jgi:hypothetical protein
MIAHAVTQGVYSLSAPGARWYTASMLCRRRDRADPVVPPEPSGQDDRWLVRAFPAALASDAADAASIMPAAARELTIVRGRAVTSGIMARYRWSIAPGLARRHADRYPPRSPWRCAEGVQEVGCQVKR